MDKNELKLAISQRLSQEELGKKFGIKQSTISYWMKKHGLNSKNTWFVRNKTVKFCPRCQQEKPIDDFYKRKNGKGIAPYCKTCSRDSSVERSSALKKQCVDYLGGKCVVCGYDKNLAALEFHHKNPKEKDFAITRKALCSFESIRLELDKCELLCCRCHREHHHPDCTITP